MGARRRIRGRPDRLLDQTRLILLASLLACPQWLSAGQEQLPDPIEVTREAAVEAYTLGDFHLARKRFEKLLDENPKDASALYNLACVESRLGNTEQAMSRLIEAISFGFVDFHLMAEDADLHTLHQHERYRAILLGWRTLLDARGKAELESMEDAFDDEYTFSRDEKLRLNYASAFDHQSFENARNEIERVAGWAYQNIFDQPPMQSNAPHAWVSIILPTQRDFVRLVGGVRIGGYYDVTRKRLVSQDLGPSLRHEFFHVLHWRDMHEKGQEHPYWIMEGLAAILEDVESSESEYFQVLPSWRTNIVKRMERAGRLIPWETFCTLDRRRFLDHRPSANYAQARAMFMFLHARGLLRTWYEQYCGGYHDDATGLKAIEIAFGQPISKVEKSFRAWVAELPEVAEISRPGQASLGFRIGPGKGDGTVVQESVPRSRLREADPESSERLRPRDVIESIDGTPVPTMDDLFRVLGGYQPGDRVVLTIRRNDQRRNVPLLLVDDDEQDDEPFGN